MLKTMKLASVAILAIGMLSACASKQVATDLDAKLAKEEVQAPSSEIPKHAFDQINKSKLTDEQKTRLNVLVAKVINQSSTTKVETMKLKKVLFKNLASTPYNSDEVDLIKERLTDLEKTKLKTMFTALDEVRSILGENEKDRQHVLEMMLDMDRTPSRLE